MQEQGVQRVGCGDVFHGDRPRPGGGERIEAGDEPG